MAFDKTKKDCPRGFVYSKSKKGCVPEGSDVSDKLIVKYERYFFKEGTDMDKKCKDGYRWCPIMKKCMPPDHFKGKGRGMHRGQGEGPIGKPYREASKLVDMAFDEGFEIFGKAITAEKKIDRILDSIEDTLDEGVAGDTLKSVAVWTAADAAMTGVGRGVSALMRKRRAKKACIKYKGNPEQYKKCIARASAIREDEKVDYGKGTQWSGRPYDHPKKIRVTADVEECDMQHPTPNDHDYHHPQDYADGDMPPGPMDNDPMDAQYDDDDDSFEGEFNTGPSDEETAQKHTNDINTVPNQNGKAQYKALRKQMGEGNWYQSEGIKDKFQKRRCEKIKRDIASFRKGYENCKEKYVGQRLQDCLEPLRGGRQGLVAQAKKWGCIK